jgi:hypothetical protein
MSLMNNHQMTVTKENTMPEKFILKITESIKKGELAVFCRG